MIANRYLTTCFTTLFAVFTPLLSAQEICMEEEFYYEEQSCCEVSSICLLPYKGKASFRYHNHGGNEGVQEYFVDGKVTREALYCDQPHYKWITELEAEWKKKNKDGVFMDKGVFKAKYEHRFAPCWVWRAEHETRWGKKDQIRYRIINGVGLGYYLVENCTLSFQPKAMIRHVDSQHKQKVVEFDEHAFWPALGWELGWKLPYDLELDWEAYYGANVEESGRYRVYSDIELTIPCGGGWAIDIEHEYTYRSRIANPKLKRFDSDIKMKIAYCF